MVPKVYYFLSLFVSFCLHIAVWPFSITFLSGWLFSFYVCACSISHFSFTSFLCSWKWRTRRNLQQRKSQINMREDCDFWDGEILLSGKERRWTPLTRSSKKQCDKHLSDLVSKFWTRHDWGLFQPCVPMINFRRHVSWRSRAIRFTKCIARFCYQIHFRSPLNHRQTSHVTCALLNSPSHNPPVTSAWAEPCCRSQPLWEPCWDNPVNTRHRSWELISPKINATNSMISCMQHGAWLN